MEAAREASQPQLRKGALGLFAIVSAVIATNGPLTALVGAVPVSLTMGNGIGLPSVFVIVGLVYVLFSVGFTAMSKYTTNAGAFYAYIAQGLGRPWGISAAFVAIVSYNAMQLACYGMLGFFLSTGLHDWIGIDVPWWICCLGALLVILVASITNIEISGRLLFLLLTAEMLVIAAFDVAAVLHGGPAGYTLAPFTAQHTFTAGFGTAIVFVVGSYMGFETTAIYAEEAKEPHRNIPLATYISITTIMVLYTFSVWALIVVWGPTEVVSMAGKDPAGLWYGMAERIAGKFVSEAMQVLMLTSLFAALLSFHNTTSRYIFSLGREQVLPKVLSTVSRGQQAPVVACAVQAAAVAAALLLFAWSKSDPMNVVLPYTAALSTIGLLSVQCLTSLSVISFFMRGARGENAWVRQIAPAASAIALAWFVFMEVSHLDLMTGSTSRWIYCFPYGIAALALGGVMYALWLRKARPDRYSSLGRFLSEL
ncbi:APC family permease [Burkholderia vietnamiensis]|uniref:APC family permease n=1 Tax=Burkholderia vietnamiensis TaxID=60552 RepID=UPI00075E7AC4|nr:APC family permease [Burkholderia vietnamiensis]KVE63952.1 amino acid permease [Burkholderia vietnamiensis]KVE94953.1 amino acid permease [Burkholderia vietnamiensis]MBR7915517.1 APC family permease [Burkholderia vietnamiensis]